MTATLPPSVQEQLTPEQQVRRVTARATATVPLEEDPDVRELTDRATDAIEELDDKGLNPVELAKLTAEDFVDLVELLFSLIALRRGEHWELAQSEGARMRKWAQKVVERYGVPAAAKWLPLAVLVGLMLLAGSRRFKEDKRLAQEAEKTQPLTVVNGGQA